MQEMADEQKFQRMNLPHPTCRNVLTCPTPPSPKGEGIIQSHALASIQAHLWAKVPFLGDLRVMHLIALQIPLYH